MITAASFAAGWPSNVLELLPAAAEVSQAKYSADETDSAQTEKPSNRVADLLEWRFVGQPAQSSPNHAYGPEKATEKYAYETFIIFVRRARGLYCSCHL
jgi:hypothetical protein